MFIFQDLISLSTIESTKASSSSNDGIAFFWITLLVIIGIGIVSQIVQSKFKKTNLHYSQVPSIAGKTGSQVAQEILNKNNIKNVQIIMNNKEGQDHYNPQTNIIMLSPSVYNSSSLAAIAIAAHESGHAIQWGRREIGIRIRDTIAKPIGIINKFTGAIFSMWIILLLFGYPLIIFVWVGLIMYASTSLFQVVTLPIEFGASRKAKNQLNELGFIQNSEEEIGVKKLLNAAAMTYVIAFLSSLILFALYLLMILSRRRR